MDLQMPIMDGIEAAKIIRNTENLNKETVIVALTASALSDHRNQALDVGMNDFVTKPFTPDELLKVFNKYFADQEQNSDSTNKEIKDQEVNADRIENTSPDLVEEKKSIQFESYHPQLDKAYLEAIYGDDWEYAADMFETFLQDIYPNFEKLMPLVEKEEWDQYYKLAHKVKPSLQMVGLPALQKKVLAVEIIAKTKPESAKLKIATQEILNEMENFLPIVQQQLDFLQAKMVKQ